MQCMFKLRLLPSCKRSRFLLYAVHSMLKDVLSSFFFIAKLTLEEATEID